MAVPERDVGRLLGAVSTDGMVKETALQVTAAARAIVRDGNRPSPPRFLGPAQRIS
jgi:hypothetical protein